MPYGANPYILFLILILLMLGLDPEASKKILVVKNVMDRMTSAFNNFQTGISSMATDFEDIHVMLRDMRIDSDEKK